MKRDGRKGYVLLEVVLAVTLVAIGLSVLMDCLGRCLAATRSIRNYTVSGMLLANKSCEFRLDRAEDTQNQEGDFEQYPGYTWRRVLEPTDTEGLWQQTVTVLWVERGRESSDSLVEYRYFPRKQR
jgi:Tfp pilus assembly protein PilV